MKSQYEMTRQFRERLYYERELASLKISMWAEGACAVGCIVSAVVALLIR